MRLDAEIAAALDAYVGELQAATANEEADTRAADALRRYYESMQQVWSVESSRQASEAYADYLGAVQERLAPDKPSGRATEGFRRFVQTVQETWSSADLETVDAASLAGVGQALSTAAWLASLDGPDGDLPGGGPSEEDRR